MGKTDCSAAPRRVVFVSAEFAPVVKVGGLGEASAGLVQALRAEGIIVDVIIPDDHNQILDREVHEPLGVPSWAGPASARHGTYENSGPITLVKVPGIGRPHPYIQPATGEGWHDNDYRFLAFAAAVAELIALDPPDIVHLNDWHTSAVPAFLRPRVPTVLTVHNIAHQGQTGLGWLERLGPLAMAYEHLGQLNPLAGAIRLTDAVVAVSTTYAQEILQPKSGHGLHDVLKTKGDRLLGIRNGIARKDWDPMGDRSLPAPFSKRDLSGKKQCRRELLSEVGLQSRAGPVIGMVARLDHQKGIDIALSLASVLNSLPARLILHGSGNPGLADHARRVAAAHSSSLTVIDGYRDETAHQIMAGSDLVLVPSRFEPCGLTQMQAMSYGTMPVVTNVGGLRDTVIDLTKNNRHGTGFVAHRPDTESVSEALCRAVHAWQNPDRRARAQRRGMSTDWSWSGPAGEYIELYQDLLEM